MAARLFALAAPIIGLNVLNVLALVIDTAMCGRLDNGEAALAALGFATQVVFLLMILMFGLSIGTVALVARAHGAGHSDQVKHVLQQSTALTIGVGVFVAAAGTPMAPLLLRLLGASPEATELGVAYLRPALIFCVFHYLSMLCASNLRGIGNTSLPFRAQLLATALNVVLNYGLIFGRLGMPALGVEGAAIGTAVSHAFAVVVMVVSIQRGSAGVLRITVRGFRFDPGLVRRLLRVGAPAAADMLLVNLAFLSMIALLGRLDEAAVAAHGVGLRVQALAFVPGLGVSQATGAMVGQALGAGDLRGARRVVKASMLLSTSLMSVLALVILGVAGSIVAVFDIVPGTDLFNYAMVWMRILGAGMPIVGLHIALIGMLQGAGATRTSLQINLVGTVLVQLPFSVVFALPLAMGPFGVWLAFPLASFAKLLLCLRVYRAGHWAKVGIEG